MKSGGPAADNQLTSLIVVVRGANENKCEPLHRANTTNGSETARTWAGPRSRCWVLIRCWTCSYATLQLLISVHVWNGQGQLVGFNVACLSFWSLFLPSFRVEQWTYLGFTPADVSKMNSEIHAKTAPNIYLNTEKDCVFCGSLLNDLFRFK